MSSFLLHREALLHRVDSRLRSTNAIGGQTVRASADGSASGYVPCLANGKTPMRPYLIYFSVRFMLGLDADIRHTLSNGINDISSSATSPLGMNSPKKSSQPIMYH